MVIHTIDVRASKSSNSLILSYLLPQLGAYTLDVRASNPSQSIILSYLLPQSGVHTIDVRASNPSSSDDIPTKTITMYELIEGLVVEEVNDKVMDSFNLCGVVV